jgi:hypothetical protein
LVDLRLEGFRMSNIQEARTGDIRSVEETANDRERNRRFTPLRSYVSRTRPLAKAPRGELALSRLIPVPRLQS